MKCVALLFRIHDRMVYINMGHGDECFSDATQNLLFVNAFRFVVSCGGSL